MKEIRSHTSLRGIAAILVAYYHIDAVVLDEVKASNVTMLIENSFALVDLFFVLSGFIMTFAYANIVDGSAAGRDLVAFYIARFCRIYPLHFVTLIFMVLLLFYERGFSGLWDSSRIIFENILLVHAWGLSDRFILNFPSWSVSVELFAYLLFPLLAWIMRARRGWVFLLLLVSGFYFYMFVSFSTFHVDEKLGLVRGLPSFVIGMLIFKIKNSASAFSSRGISLLQLVCLISIVTVMHFDANEFYLLALFPIMALALWQDRGVVAKLLSNSVFVYFGTISYSIYLLHIPVRNSFFYIFPKLGLDLSGRQENTLFILVTLLATVMLSACVYRFYEAPARDNLRLIFRQKLDNLTRTAAK